MDLSFFRNINRALVVVAHPDDEVLGAGGTIKLMTDAGIDVSLLVFTDGVSARFSNMLNEEAKINARMERKEALSKACSILKIKSFELLDYPDNQLDEVATLILAQEIERRIQQNKPNLIFSHASEDLNQDHIAVSNAVNIASRPLVNLKVRADEKLQGVITFQVISSMEYYFNNIFKPNLFVDISAHIDIKKDALEAYDKELNNYPHPRSKEGLDIHAKFNGLKVAEECCESFKINWLKM